MSVQAGIKIAQSIGAWFKAGGSGIKDLGKAGYAAAKTSFKAGGNAGRFAKAGTALKDGGRAVGTTFATLTDGQKVAAVAAGTIAADQGRRALFT